MCASRGRMDPITETDERWHSSELTGRHMSDIIEYSCRELLLEKSDKDAEHALKISNDSGCLEDFSSAKGDTSYEESDDLINKTNARDKRTHNIKILKTISLVMAETVAVSVLLLLY